MTALEAAQQMVDSGKYRETDGPNRSPAIDALCTEFGVPLGSSWCALFGSKAFEMARASGEHGDPFHYTAGSQDLLAWFKANHTVTTDAQQILNWKGALVIRADPGGLHGHVALVKGRLTDDGKVVAITTLEGNTDMHGGSNGDGAYERKRLVPLEPYLWTFCRTDNIAGGGWF